MKRILKTLSLAAVAAMAVMAFVGAATASANHKVKACEDPNGNTNCIQATNGETAFESTTSNVQLSNKLITNTCSGSVAGVVTDNESTGETDPIEAEITGAEFWSCNVAPVTAEELPWFLSTTHKTFPSGRLSGGVQVTLEVGGFVGNCTFAEDATHFVTGTWTNAARSTITLGGSLKKIAGGFLCGSEGTISGTYAVSSVTDPNLTSPTNIRIEP